MNSGKVTPGPVIKDMLESLPSFGLSTDLWGHLWLVNLYVGVSHSPPTYEAPVNLTSKTAVGDLFKTQSEASYVRVFCSPCPDDW